MLNSHPVLPLTFLLTSAKRGDLVEGEGAAGNFGGKYAGACLKAMSHAAGHVKVAEAWHFSGLRWESFLPECQDVPGFLKANVSGKRRVNCKEQALGSGQDAPCHHWKPI